MTKKFTRWLLPFQCLICILTIEVALYVYIDKTNEITQIKLTIPHITKETKRLHEENSRLQYEIQQFESPIHLIELARKPEFGHLKNPYIHEVLQIEEK